MLQFFKKKNKGEELKLKIDGMHCVSCAMSIDSALEDLEGVFESKTNYARGETKIFIDPKLDSKEKIVQTIKELGYEIRQ